MMQKADWDEAKPVRVRVKIPGSSQADVIVTLRDGSRYKTHLGKPSSNRLPLLVDSDEFPYDDTDMHDAIAEAVSKHALYDFEGRNTSGMKGFIEEFSVR